MLRKTVSSIILFGVCSTPLMALAQHDDDHHDDAHHQQYVRHDDWKKGYHMHDEDWRRGERVDDWRTYHLSETPHGYEWREIDGNYVLASTNGVDASVVVASPARH